MNKGNFVLRYVIFHTNQKIGVKPKIMKKYLITKT